MNEQELQMYKDAETAIAMAFRVSLDVDTLATHLSLVLRSELAKARKEERERRKAQKGG